MKTRRSSIIIDPPDGKIPPFTGKTRYAFFYHGITDENYYLTERFTRTDTDTILYPFTIDDPTIYTPAVHRGTDDVETRGHHL